MLTHVCECEYIHIYNLYMYHSSIIYVYSSVIHKLYDYCWELQLMLFNCIIVHNWVLDVNVDLRQAETWDPLLHCCEPCRWTHLFLRNKTKKKNLYGFKSNCTHASVKVNSVQKMQRDQKLQLPFLKGLEKKQGVRCKSRANPCTQHHIRGGQTTQETPWAPCLDSPLPSPHRRNKLVPYQGVSKQGTLLFVLIPLCCSRRPNKASPEFPSGL